MNKSCFSGALAPALLFAALAAPPTAAAEESLRYTPPKPGTVAEYRLTTQMHTDQRVVKRIILWTTTALADRTPYDGVAAFRLRNVYRIKQQGRPDRISTEIIVRRLEDGNELATLNAGGQLIKDIKPHGGTYRWPAGVGMRWSAKTVRRTLRTGQTKAQQTSYTIAAVEDVTLPAGTFKSIRIEGEAGAKATGGKMTFWFLPAVGLEGRWLMTQALTAKFGDETIRKVEFEIVMLSLERP